MLEYEGREQSLVKHFILRKYLERFAHIIGSWWPSITYVDCFSGPWNVQSQDLRDSSFAIAVAELRKAKQTWAEKGRQVRVRCFFLEKDRKAFGELQRFAGEVTDAEIRTVNARLQDAIPDIVSFLESDRDTFPFILIDPTGWTGFELDVIRPLLQRNPGEVLVNFMTSFIRRFIKSADEATIRSFERMFGPFLPPMWQLTQLSEEDLDDALVTAYAALLRATGAYKYVCNAIVLHPDIDSTHFHLIYATRHLKGIEVFKQAEQRAMTLQEDARADVRGKRLEKEEPLLFSRQAMGRPQHFLSLQQRYLAKAKSALVRALSSREQLPYDEAYATALSFPIVQPRDLKQWILAWQRDSFISIEGLPPRKRAFGIAKSLRLVPLKPLPLD